MPVVLCCLLLALPTAGAESADALLRSARAALAKGDADRALELTDKAVAADPQGAATRLFRATIHDALRRHVAALADLDKAVALDPRLAAAYNLRGAIQFKRGAI